MAISYTSIDTRETVRGKREVTRWIKETISSENHILGDIAIALCSDSYINKANVEFLGHDYPTDIITFDYSEQKILSGDILISVDTVRSNAQKFQVTFEEELRRVIIHGILHLCGYKDKTIAQQKQMRAKENFYLAR